MDGFKKPVEPVEPKKRTPKKAKEEKPIALEISCDAKDRERVAENLYSENMQADGTLLLVNPVCGGSMLIKDFQYFPKVNRKCTCGKVGHFMVKYSLNK